MKKYFLNVTKIFTIVAFVAGLLISGLLLIADDEITFQSMESKNEGSPIFNSVKWIKKDGKEIWMMNQAHQGLDSKVWDRLAIILETKNNEKTATFLQLPPGKLEWNDNLINQRIDNRVSCFMCHSNGPRAIRYEATPKIDLTVANKLKIFLWNLRIKTYGRIKENSFHAKTDPDLKMPFRHQSKMDNEILQVKTCMQCHSNDGFLARGHLTRQNSISIAFMMQNKFMPPPGFDLPEEEKVLIERFMEGF